MSVFVLTHTTLSSHAGKSEILGVYATEPLALAAISEKKAKLLSGEGAEHWISVEESEGGRTLAYGGKGGISFTPGFYRVTEHEVIGV